MKRARVYTASVGCLSDMSLYNRALDVIPAARRECADRMKIWSGKYLSAGAGLLLCASLADYIQDPGRPVCMKDIASFHSLRIELGEYGKPYLPDWPEVHFNLSHSGSYAMCIVSPAPAGCDIEKIEERNIDGVIRCFAPSEQIAARSCAENFFRIWTLKESIIKLSGRGLGILLKSFEVSLDPLSVSQDFLKRPVRLKEYDALRMPGHDMSHEAGWKSGTCEQSGAGGRSGARGQSGAGERSGICEQSGAGERSGTRGQSGVDEAGEAACEERYCCSCAVEDALPPEEMTVMDLEYILTH